jgi:putative ABC transport system substrate-binding protein
MLFDQLKRREFITLLGGSAVAWPLAARAQREPGVRLIAMLMGQAESDPGNAARIAAFRQALAPLGWIDGRNVRIEYRWGAGDPGRLQAAAQSLAAPKPDVFVSESTPAAVALKQVAAGVPIVFVQVANPIGSGLVESLPRPGGSMTGFINYEPSMAGKWLEVLKEVAPRVARVGALFNPRTHSGQYWSVLESAAASLALEFTRIPVLERAEIGPAIAGLARAPNGGLAVMPDSFTITNQELIIGETARHRVPAVYPYDDFAQRGGLVAYGHDVIDDYRRAASYVGRILRGEKPADLPVQAPTKFVLVINVKTAKALGLDVPPVLLARADEVIE